MAVRSRDSLRARRRVPTATVKPSMEIGTRMRGSQSCESQLSTLHLTGEDLPELTSWYLSPAHYQSRIPSEYSTLRRNKPFTLASTTGRHINLDEDELDELRSHRVEELSLETFTKPEKTALTQRLYINAAFNSPYLGDLARLKKEKLKLEEAYILKKKCENELERTRGPRPKWYELKTKDFHREANRNNFMLSNHKNLEDISEYRSTLGQSLSRWSSFEL